MSSATVAGNAPLTQQDGTFAVRLKSGPAYQAF